MNALDAGVKALVGGIHLSGSSCWGDPHGPPCGESLSPSKLALGPPELWHSPGSAGRAAGEQQGCNERQSSYRLSGGICVVFFLFPSFLLFALYPPTIDVFGMLTPCVFFYLNLEVLTP